MTEPDDRELNALLEKRSDLASLYRHAHMEEPPRHLDEAIRAAARRAVAPEKFSRREHWAMPAAAAAVLVVGISVSVLVRDIEPPISTNTGVALSDASHLSPEKMRAEEAAAPSSPKSSQRQATQAKLDDLARAEKSTQTVRGVKQAATASEPKQVPLGLEQRRPDAPVLAVQPAATAAQAAASTDAMQEQNTSPRANSPVINDAALDAVKSKREASLKQSDQETVAATQASAPAATGKQASAQAERKSITDGDVSELKKSLAQVRSPEQWLKDIERLRRQGRPVEAERSLAEFRRQYPLYPIPPLNP